jgi:hypothetical protein
MKTLSAVLALAVAVPCSAAAPALAPERLAAIAAGAGLTLPAASLEAPRFAPVKGRAARPVRALDGVSSGPAYGSGFVTGSGYISCSSRDNHPGYMSGWIRLEGDIPVTGPDGTRGNVRVSDTVMVSGSCANGAGFVTGSSYLNGSGYLYKDGRAAGRADLSGHVFISRYVSGYAFFNEYVNLNGSFRAD